MSLDRGHRLLLEECCCALPRTRKTDASFW